MSPRARTRRAQRFVIDWIIYRLDQVLDLGPLAQIALVVLITLLLVGLFSAVALLLLPEQMGMVGPLEATWWTLTHFLDGGTMASDEPSRRPLALLVTGAGILVVSLLTAFLSSKMGERIADMRSGLNAVVERGHVLCLGYDPNVPLLARELSRSGQRVTLVVLATEPKDRVEAALRIAQRVPGSRLRTVVRTGDPRVEQALLRVAAHRAAKVLVVPPVSLDDEQSVRWSLGAMLALRRVVGTDWSGSVLALARHQEAIELLQLATERDVAGDAELRTEVIAVDAVIAGVLAQSTREDGVYQVLRRLLAFDGCELYTVALPGHLVGRSFDFAHAAIDTGVVVGRRRRGVLELCPKDGGAPLEPGDQLLVMSDHGQVGSASGTLPPAPPIDPQSIHPPGPERVSIVGCTQALPHLLQELAGFLPHGSHVRVVLGAAHAEGRAMVDTVRTSRITIRAESKTAADLVGVGDESICHSDVVVILGQESDDDANGDASALAMLLRLRRGMRLCGTDRARVVTEVRDPRSAAHVAPRPGDCIVSSDVIAMLLAQETLDEGSADVYRELLHPGGAYVSLRPRDQYLPPGERTFAELLASARRRGDVALGFFPDPREERDEGAERQRLEEGDPMGANGAWLNPPRSTVVPDDEGTLVAVLTRSR